MDFSDHVYVMSGVSGGSVGLGFYRAILELDKAHPEIKLPRNKRLEQLLARDYLSGSLGRLLFTDLPTSGLPIRPHWVDRSAALSTSFVQAWKDTTAEWGVPNSSTLENRLSDFDIGSGPNLLLNATSVSKQSPFAMSRLCLNIHSYSLQNFSDQCDLTLADAMGLSARFPGISSAGVLRWPGTKPKTWKQDAFVDGGYFDNSGLESLNRVLQAIENGLLAHPEIKVRFLVIRIGSDLTEKTLDEKNMIKALPAGSDDLSPLLSATTVYLSTIVNSERRLFDRVDAVRYRHFWSHQSSQDQDLKFASLAYVPIVLNYRKTGDKDDKLPLGWIISRRSISNIGGAIGDPEADAPLERDLLGSDNQSMLWRTRFWLLDNPAKFYRFPTVNPVHDDN